MEKNKVGFFNMEVVFPLSVHLFILYYIISFLSFFQEKQIYDGMNKNWRNKNMIFIVNMVKWRCEG